jgi:hypothetical protein
VYSEEQKLKLRQDHYLVLHQINTFLKTGEIPASLETKSARQGFKRKAPNFCIVAKQLHKKTAARPCRVHWEDELLPVLKETHEGWSHYPKDQSKFRIKVENTFFFPQLAEVTRNFILSYDTCQKEKAGLASRTDRDINPTPPTDPFFRVHVDLCGPFRNKFRKKRFIFVCVDAVTKYAYVKVLPNKKAATVARAFEEEILLRQSCPFEVVTDQGSEFNKEFKELLQKAGLKHVKVRPINPRAKWTSGTLHANPQV